jgi:penicillin-binding protein 2
MAKEYRISIEDDIITPEETLLDSGSEFSDLERPIRASVFKTIFWGVTGLLAMVFLFTAKLSVADFSYYANLAFQNRSANFVIPPARGIIFDSSGTPLVKNIPQFDVVGVAKEIKSATKNNTLDTARLSGILKVSTEDLKSMLASKSQETSTFTVSANVSKEQILAIQALNPPGIYVIPDVARVYTDGPAFSSVLGYVGKVSKDDLSSDPYYTANDIKGKLGVESEYESVLRGEHGRIFFGDTADKINVQAQTGQNLVLNIDGALQQELYNDLHAILASAGLSRGAAIIQNPQNGAVLAMVSFPSYDNNEFANGLTQAEYNQIFQSSARPLFNRVISGTYNPGSTIKPFMGLAGLQEHVITPNTTIQDCISITIPNPYNGTTYTFNNWRADHGPFDLRRAIANSCNVFFASVGGGYGNISGLGITKMDQYFKNGLIDKSLGIDLPGETHGFIPSPDWKLKTKGEQWYQGDTFNTSIGQGDLTVTPLWLNTYLSAIANGGTMYQPRVADRIVDSDKNTVQVFQPKALEKLPFSDQNLAIVKDDMRETILSGTATLLKDLPVVAAAKTGTAQVVNGQQINSLFVVFAPFDHPQVAMTVLVENPTSEGLAVRTANQVLKWYFTRTASASQ